MIKFNLYQDTLRRHAYEYPWSFLGRSFLWVPNMTQEWRTLANISAWLTDHGIFHHIEWEKVYETDIKQQDCNERYETWDYRLCINEMQDAAIFRLFHPDIPLCKDK